MFVQLSFFFTYLQKAINIYSLLVSVSSSSFTAPLFCLATLFFAAALRPSVPGGFYFLIFLLSGTYWATCQTLQRCVLLPPFHLSSSLSLSLHLSMQSNQFGCLSCLHLTLFVVTFLCLWFQWLCFVAALRHGRPCAAFAVPCLLSNALDAKSSQSHEPHSTVRQWTNRAPAVAPMNLLRFQFQFSV